MNPAESHTPGQNPETSNTNSELRDSVIRAVEESDTGLRERLKKLIRQFLGQRYQNDVEDLVNETLFKATQFAHTFKGDSSIDTWMHRITSNVCLDFLRKKKCTTRNI